MNEQHIDAAAGADKDATIRELRRALGAAQSENRILKRRLAIEQKREEAAESGTDRRLLDELREAAPRRPVVPRSQVAVRLGRKLGFWRSPAVKAATAAVLAGFAIDSAIGLYQQHELQTQRAARVRLENTALGALYVELRRIVFQDDGKSYRMTINLQNSDPEHPLYVMLNPVDVYVQSGMSWQQVPSHPVEGVSWGVVKVTDTYTYDVVFTPEVANWAELVPGYMHVRIQDDMLVSEKAQPGEDIVERRTPFYVYLKPHDADDEAIKARSKMSGTPPVFIPMPAH